LAETIRTEETEEQRIPIIAITADALKGTAQKCYTAGMDDYLTKPMQLEVLNEMLAKWMPVTDEKETLDAVDEVVEVDQDVDDSADESSSSIVDADMLGNLVGSKDPAILKEFYMDFLQSGGKTAGEMRQAHTDGDLSVLGNLAHKLKSSARTVGANSLADCCLAIEQAGKEANSENIEALMDSFNRLYEQVENWINKYPA